MHFLAYGFPRGEKDCNSNVGVFLTRPKAQYWSFQIARAAILQSGNPAAPLDCPGNPAIRSALDCPGNPAARPLGPRLLRPIPGQKVQYWTPWIASEQFRILNPIVGGWGLNLLTHLLVSVCRADAPVGYVGLHWPFDFRLYRPPVSRGRGHTMALQAALAPVDPRSCAPSPSAYCGPRCTQGLRLPTAARLGHKGSRWLSL